MTRGGASEDPDHRHEEECQIATDRLARIFDVRRAPRPNWIDGEKYQVQFDARLREQEQE